MMSATHTSMGSTLEEAENLQKDHKKFESTANVSVYSVEFFLIFLRYKKTAEHFSNFNKLKSKKSCVM